MGRYKLNTVRRPLSDVQAGGNLARPGPLATGKPAQAQRRGQHPPGQGTKYWHGLSLTLTPTRWAGKDPHPTPRTWQGAGVGWHCLCRGAQDPPQQPLVHDTRPRPHAMGSIPPAPNPYPHLPAPSGSSPCSPCWEHGPRLQTASHPYPCQGPCPHPLPLPPASTEHPRASEALLSVGGTPQPPAPHRVALPNLDLHHTEHPRAFLTTQTPSLCTLTRPHFPSRGRGWAAWQCTVLPPRGDDTAGCWRPRCHPRQGTASILHPSREKKKTEPAPAGIPATYKPTTCRCWRLVWGGGGSGSARCGCMHGDAWQDEVQLAEGPVAGLAFGSCTRRSKKEPPTVTVFCNGKKGKKLARSCVCLSGRAEYPQWSLSSPRYCAWPPGQVSSPRPPGG